MGGVVSCLPRYGCCVPKSAPDTCKENHTTYTSTPRANGACTYGNGYGNGSIGSTSKKKKKHCRNLSAAFNMADLEFTAVSGAGGAGDGLGGGDATADLLNVNVATEEELMTLPGINRHTAHNIVEYRKQIGAFKKVEDLALVSGVGATKLSILRAEICVRKGAKSSSSSSTSSSRQDLSLTQDNISRSSSSHQTAPIYSVNTSNVFQLMKVKGISQALAENVVMYREKKGAFRNLDELLKVKGFKPYVLSAVRQYLTTDEIVTNGYTTAAAVMVSASTDPTLNRTNPSQTNLVDTGADSQEDMISLYGPLTKKSFRGGKRKQQYFAKRNGRPVMRVGSWNLQSCAEEKSNNPGVKEVFAMTVLENGLGIVGIQELGDAEALQKLCDELNHPSIPTVRKFQGHRGVWRCVTSEPAGKLLQQSPEHLGFLYDVSRGVELLSTVLLSSASDGSTPLACKPYVAMFRVREFDVAVVNVHSAGTGDAATDALEDTIAAVEKHLPANTHRIIVGDFAAPPDADEVLALRQRQYQSALPADKYTNISMRNPEGSRCYDNVWFGTGTSNAYTGTSDVIREGLTSPWIPNGWGWGGLASEHCPTWAEFYTDADPDTFPSPVNGGGDSRPISMKDIQCALKMGVVAADL